MAVTIRVGVKLVIATSTDGAGGSAGPASNLTVNCINTPDDDLKIAITIRTRCCHS
jgi:hypothetical protein